MKTIIKTSLLASVIALTFACSKKSDTTTTPTTTGFSNAVQKVAPQATIDALRAKGMTINEGTTPPKLEGIFLESPVQVMATFTGDTEYKVGDVINNYTYKFYEQTSDNGSVKVAYKSGTDNATGLGSVVAGNGSKFTIFSELSTTAGNTVINIISGEITASGIKDWQDSYVNKSTLDKVRIFKDGDGLASATSTFRMPISGDNSGNLISNKLK